MNYQIFIPIGGYINLDKVIAAAQCSQAPFQPLCLPQTPVAGQAGQVEALHTPLPYASSAGNLMNRRIHSLKINFYRTKRNRIHPAADIHSDNVGNHLIVDRHRGADRAAFPGMNIRHNTNL